jgi:hypothetical protein
MVEMLAETRPTAINLKWALMADARRAAQPAARTARGHGLERGGLIADEDEAMSKAIGRTVLPSSSDIAPRSRRDGQHPHPLQCRLAGDGGLRHRAGADLPGA